MSASTVSSTGSVTRRRTAMTPAAVTPPATAPPAARTANWPALCSSIPPAVVRAVPATAMETATWNSTRLVASLNRLSACTSTWTFGGSDSRARCAGSPTKPSAASAASSTAARPSTNCAGSSSTPTAARSCTAATKTRPCERTATPWSSTPTSSQRLVPGRCRRRGPRRRVRDRGCHHRAPHLARFEAINPYGLLTSSCTPGSRAPSRSCWASSCWRPTSPGHGASAASSPWSSCSPW